MGERKYECCEMLGYCCLCRYSIASSGGYFGRSFENRITGKTHHYCYKCFATAVDVYLAELKLKEANGNPSHNN